MLELKFPFCIYLGSRSKFPVFDLNERIQFCDFLINEIGLKSHENYTKNLKHYQTYSQSMIVIGHEEGAITIPAITKKGDYFSFWDNDSCRTQMLFFNDGQYDLVKRLLLNQNLYILANQITKVINLNTKRGD